MNGGWGISYEIALRWMPLDLTNDKSTLVQVMVLCRQASSHYLSQCWPSSLSPYGVTRPQWVKSCEQKGPKEPALLRWFDVITRLFTNSSKASLWKLSSQHLKSLQQHHKVVVIQNHWSLFTKQQDISQKQAAAFGVKKIISFWNLTSALTAGLWRAISDNSKLESCASEIWW